MYNKVFIVDASYQLHRSLHVPEIFNLSTSSGIRSGGIFGFSRILIKELAKYRGYYPVLCWDSGLSPRRVAIYDNYKRNLERNTSEYKIAAENDEYLTEYFKQREALIEMASYVGIPSLRVSNWEGDDLVYIMTTLSKESVVLSDDKDMYQLVRDGVILRRPMADSVITYDSNDKWTKSLYNVIYKSILGDPSDNIPKSCKGIGGKSAEILSDIMYEYYTQGLSDDDIRIKLTESDNNKFRVFADNYDQYLINKGLVDLSLVEITQSVLEGINSVIDYSVVNGDYFKLREFYNKYEIRDLDIDKLLLILSMSISNLFNSEVTNE